MEAKPFISAALSACVLLAAVGTARAQFTVAPDQSIGASDAQPYDALGYGLAADGSALLAGARGNDSIALNGGAVYAFTRVATGWVQSQKIVFTNAQAGDEIGTAVALRGSVGVAGAPSRGAGGTAFVLRFDGGAWFPVVELSDAAAGAGADFGAAVACTPDFVAVGAPASAEGVGAFAGRVRLFVRNGTQWTEGAMLRADFPDPGDRFGFALAMDGDWLAVTAPGDDDAGSNAGAVWLFRATGGRYQLAQKLLPPSTAGSVAGASFGQSVALRGSTLAVGATLIDSSAVDAGAVFRYDLSASGAALRETLIPPGGALDAHFGFSVATDGTSLVVGAPGLLVGGQMRGGGFLYLNGPTPSGVLAPAGTAALLLTGTRVAMTPTSVLASAPIANSGVVGSAGRVYALDRTRDCDASGIPDAIEIANGSLEDGNGDSVPDTCQCLADLTGDGVVAAPDLAVLLGFWGSTNPTLPGADINRDGIVAAQDLAELLGSWGPCQ